MHIQIAGLYTFSPSFTAACHADARAILNASRDFDLKGLSLCLRACALADLARIANRTP